MITALMLISVVFTWGMGKFPHQTVNGRADPVITASAEKHILYGNNHGGGGHLHGQGKSCKSEFPISWNAQKVIAMVKQQAANDNINWKKADNGYEVAETDVEGTRIRIILNGKNNEIVTAYPVGGKRNSCFNE